MADVVNMSLDEIIKQNKQNNRVSRSRGRGGGTVRGRGGGRGRGRGAARGRSQSRPGTPAAGRQGRSRSRAQSLARSQSRTRSRSRQQRRSMSRGRSASASRSRSRLRGLTPKGRAGLENQQNMPPLVWRGKFNRGGRMLRSNSTQNLRGSVHSRLGMTTRRGAANKPLAVAKWGIAKRGRGFSTANRQYSNVGMRSDQILWEQRNNLIRQQNNMIRSQTFRRSRNNSFNSASQLTVRVANNVGKRRRNSVGNANYLNPQTLAQLTRQLGGYNIRRGPGSVRSMGSWSNKSIGSNRSNRSYRSTRSNASRQSTRSRGRGRGRGGYRGVGRNFVNKQILNPTLQREIAAIQGKSYGAEPAPVESPGGINFSPTPSATRQTLHQRFALS